MRTIISLILLIYPVFLWSQSELSLSDCLDSMEKFHPRAGDRELLEAIGSNSIENAEAAWFPQIDLNGQLSYQSDVVEIDIDLPYPDVEFPSAPKDQYKFYLEIQQTIYDGGRIRQKKILEELNTNSGISELEARLELAKAGVIEAYFAILNLQENTEMLETMLNLLRENKRIVEAGIRNGLLMESDLILVEIEILNMEQEIASLVLKKAAMISILSDRCGLELSQNDVFLNTNLQTGKLSLQRKELEVFDLQKEILSESGTILMKNRMPVLFAFGQMGYGNPGLNMLNDSFDSYYYLGAGLKWNIWDWKTTRRDKQNLQYRSSLIDHQKIEFEDQVNQALLKTDADIQTHRKSIENLKVLLNKRQEIVELYESQLEEGVIKTIDYLSVVNQAKITGLKLVNEEISLQKAIANYKYLKGTL